MFFNKTLKSESAELKSKLFKQEQVKKSLDEEMLVLIIDKTGLVTAQNKNFTDELGYSDQQLIGKKLLDFVPSNARDTGHFKSLKKAIEQREHWVGALQFVNVNGEQEWLRSILQPVVDEQGKPIEFTLHSNVLTRTIETSREHQDLIKALHRAMAVIEFDTNGIVLTANENFLAGMGYSLKEIVGQHHRIFVSLKRQTLLNMTPFGKSSKEASTFQAVLNA